VGDNADTDDGGGGVSDVDEIATGTNPLDPDSDGDGVDDGVDAFPVSNLDATVNIDGCDTGVVSQLLPNGATFNDWIGAAAENPGQFTKSGESAKSGKSAKSTHGAFVKAVSNLADGWKKAGLITGREKGAITSCAARSK
jgi:hypothetical protein